MGGDLVEEQDRRIAAARRDEIRMGEDQPEQQGLLLPGLGTRRGHLLGSMNDDEILAVGPFRGSPCRRIPLSPGP